jgi:hypothetical protein
MIGTQKLLLASQGPFEQYFSVVIPSLRIINKPKVVHRVERGWMIGTQMLLLEG